MEERKREREREREGGGERERVKKIDRQAMLKRTTVREI